MIDLGRNREEILAQIETADPQDEPLRDLSDPRVATADAQVRVQGHANLDAASGPREAVARRVVSS